VAAGLFLACGHALMASAADRLIEGALYVVHHER